MTTREVTAIGIKLLGIWLLVNMVMYIPVLTTSLASFQEYTQTELSESILFWMVTTALVTGLVASFLLFRLSNATLNAVPNVSTDENAPNQEFLLQFGGVYFIVSALRSFPSVLLSVSKITTLQSDKLFYLAGLLIQVAIGLFLVIKPNVWAEWLRKMRGRT